MLEIYFDGSCYPKNPGGYMGVGVVIKEDGVLVDEISRHGLGDRPETSNNLAEFLALLVGIEWVIEKGRQDDVVVFKGDSDFVVRVVSGQYKPSKHPKIYTPGFKSVKEKIARLKNYRILWIRRTMNEEADALSNPGRA